jgi:hypothetical protein
MTTEVMTAEVMTAEEEAKLATAWLTYCRNRQEGLDSPLQTKALPWSLRGWASMLWPTVAHMSKFQLTSRLPS